MINQRYGLNMFIGIFLRGLHKGKHHQSPMITGTPTPPRALINNRPSCLEIYQGITKLQQGGAQHTSSIGLLYHKSRGRETVRERKETLDARQQSREEHRQSS